MNANDGRVVPAYIAAALDGEPATVFGDGMQTRSFCYVSDLVDALLLVALDGNANGQIFNLGNPDEITMLGLAREVSRLTQTSGRIEFMPAMDDDPARRRPDIARMQDRYGWQPFVSLDEGLRDTISYFRARRQQPALVEAAA